MPVASAEPAAVAIPGTGDLLTNPEAGHVGADGGIGVAQRNGAAERRHLQTHPVAVGLIASSMVVLAFASYSSLGNRITAAFLAAVLVVVAASDLEYRIIPNRVVLPSIAVVLLGRIVFLQGRWPEFAIAALLAGVVFLVPNLINTSLMGMGDVKLAILLGAGLGRGVVGAVFVAFASSLPFAAATLVRGGLAARKATLPFGPFLAFGGLVILVVPRLVGLGGG